MLFSTLRRLEALLPFALPLVLALLFFPPGNQGIPLAPSEENTTSPYPNSPSAEDGFHLASDFRIVVEKSSRTLLLFKGNALMAFFPIVLGRKPLGNKELSGDGRTPEGHFYICKIDSRSEHRWSFLLSYPDKTNARRGLDRGHIDQTTYQRITQAIEHHEIPPQETALGGGIQIHGGGTHKNWTQGCIALQDDHIEQLARFVRTGTPVLVR